MGANAQTSVPTFTAGEVLTAANMNISARTGIPVFATSVTRDAAFGGTGEKTLAEGQFAYLEDSNTTQYYDGATWQSVGVAPGSVLITSVAFSAVSSVAMAAGVFTSTYNNYMVLLTINTSTATTLGLRVNFGGAARTAGNYYGGRIDQSYTNVQTTLGDNGGTSSRITKLRTSAQGLTIFVYNPTSASLNTTFYSAGSGASETTPALEALSTYGGVYDGAESHDGLTFIQQTGAGTFTGSYQVYGLAK